MSTNTLIQKLEAGYKDYVWWPQLKADIRQHEAEQKIQTTPLCIKPDAGCIQTEQPQDMVERVARAIETAGLEMALRRNEFLTLKEKSDHLAKAAITAMQEAK